MNQPKLSLALMTFNEIDGIRPTVEELVLQLQALELSFEFIIIDDGSQDGTAALADQLALQYPEVRVLHHARNLGLGEVYRSGFREASGEWLTFFPADGQVPADCLADFVAAMPNNDLLLGLIPPSKRPWLSVLISFLERTLYRTLFGTFPPFQGIFMIRTAELRKHRLRSRGRNWVNLKELIIRSTQGGCRWAVVPNSLRVRYGGETKVHNLHSILGNFVEALRLRVILLGEVLGFT